MRLTFISDTHGKHNLVQIPECDILCHSGDLTGHGDTYAVGRFLDWFNKQPAKHKVFIAGNHDFLFEKLGFVAMEQFPDYPDIHYLESDDIVLEGLKIWGGPWTPWFHDWAFNFPVDDTYGTQAQAEWSQIPDDTDILLTHGPPFASLDICDRLKNTGRNPHTGCWYQLLRITEVRPLVNAFGHIHEAYGAETKDGNGHIRHLPVPTLFLNASICNLHLQPINKPWVVEIDETTKTVRSWWNP